MAYKLSDYGPNPNVGADRNNAAGRGWGQGWPNCQWDKFVKITKVGVSVSVRREIAELVATLLEITEVLGYDVCHPPQGECCGTWGVACRAIRGTQSPSNHSWGLAIDINAPCNPMASTFQTNIPPKVIHAWEACGFYWGGRYTSRPDTMHLEYIGRPQDVAAHLARAQEIRAANGEIPGGTPQPHPPARQFEPYAKGAVPGSRTVAEWSAGDDVAFVQRFIGEKAAGRADGYFGPQTVLGVRHYQRLRGLQPDGVVGERTWANMLRRAEPPAPSPQPPAGRPTVRQGDKNDHVRDLQSRLKNSYPAYAKHLVADGDFGPKTLAVVKEFQRRAGLVVDGVVGPATWRALGM